MRRKLTETAVIHNTVPQVAYNLFDYLSEYPAIVATIEQAVPSQLALDLLLTNLNDEQLAGYSFCLDNSIALPDSLFQLWKYLYNFSNTTISAEPNGNEQQTTHNMGESNGSEYPVSHDGLVDFIADIFELDDEDIRLLLLGRLTVINVVKFNVLGFN